MQRNACPNEDRTGHRTFLSREDRTGRGCPVLGDKGKKVLAPAMGQDSGETRVGMANESAKKVRRCGERRTKKVTCVDHPSPVRDS